MEIDENKIDETVLALLYLTLHDGARAWKSFDWESMNRLHEKGFITDPVNKAKSVVLTEDPYRKPPPFEKLVGDLAGSKIAAKLRVKIFCRTFIDYAVIHCSH